MMTILILKHPRYFLGQYFLIITTESYFIDTVRRYQKPTNHFLQYPF